MSGAVVGTIGVQPRGKPGTVIARACELTAKAKRSAKQAGLIGGAVLTIAAGTYTIDVKGLPGCNANADTYMTKAEFKIYDDGHQKWGASELKNIDGRLSRIEVDSAYMRGRIDFLIGRLVPHADSSTDFSFETTSVFP